MAKNKRKFTATIYTVEYSILQSNGVIKHYEPQKFGTKNKSKIKAEIAKAFGCNKDSIIIQLITTKTTTYIIPDLASAIEAGFIVEESDILQDAKIDEDND
jgi:ribosomal protein S24E